MRTEKIEYQHTDATLEAHIAFPERENAPMVLVFHAWYGQDDFARGKAEMLAKWGYIGCAMDLYGKGVLGKNIEENISYMTPFLEDRQYLQDRMIVGMEAVTAHPMVDKNRVAAMGFCFGGLCALDLARSGVAMQGAVSFHGLLHCPLAAKRGAIEAKILVLHGHDDPMVPPEEIRGFEKEMSDAKVDWQLHSYGNTMHAFMNPSANDPEKGVLYNPVVEKRSLQSLKTFLEELYHQ